MDVLYVLLAIVNFILIITLCFGAIFCVAVIWIVPLVILKEFWREYKERLR